MNWQVNFTQKAEKDLAKLKKSNRKQAFNIVKKLAECEKNPFLHFECMKYEDTGKYKMRVGDYRVIATLEESINIVSVEKIKHRKNVYK